MKMIYRNPIIKGFNPDPSICFDGKDFYLVTSTFEFFPGVPVYKSKNLVNWELIGHCLTDEKQCDMTNAACSGGIYAPTIRFHQGMYYMVTTNVSNGGHLIVHTTDPSGKWSDPVFVDQDGIDPSLLFDDGKVYFVSTLLKDGKQCICMCEINPITGEKYTDGVVISYGGGGKYPEAPHVYKIGEYYYLMLAEGGTEYGHMETIFRSKEPYGPYEACPYNPILSHRNEQCGDIQCTGHADMVEDANGNWWMVCLAVRPVMGLLHNLGRETCLAPVRWEDGWPVVGINGTIRVEMEAELPGSTEISNFDFVDDFSGDVLKLPWTFIRNPKVNNYKLVESGIQMTGEEIGLEHAVISPTFIGIRQTEFVTHTQVELEIPSTDMKAGITSYYNSYYYYALNIVREGSILYAEIEKHLHDEKVTNNRVKIEPTNKLMLHLITNREFYYFYLEINNQNYCVGKGSVAGLCTEGTMMMTFTGVFIGVFASKGTVIFRNFDYKEINVD